MWPVNPVIRKVVVVAGMAGRAGSHAVDLLKVWFYLD
jgi:hypothetical protein